jgi:N-acetylglucosaminyldiphosphoundecaprenol N-acetyl-beta-D-mannosaminyltransferase
MKATALRPSAQVLGVDVDAIDMEDALSSVAAVLQSNRKGYVCVASVHAIMETQRSPHLAEIYIGSEMTVPDGMPLVWVGRFQGHPSMKRVAGPELMLEIFRRKEFASVTHFLYGGVEGVAEELRDKLKEQFPWVRIVGTGMPPFRDLSIAEQKEFIDTIHGLKPDIIWIGLGCPKQEQFMYRYLPMLETKLMFGVGAAFDFHTGRIRDCADWVKRAGLQWLHRLLQDPQRLWRRYLWSNSAFIWHIALQLTGLRRYPRVLETKTSTSEKRDHAEVHS